MKWVILTDGKISTYFTAPPIDPESQPDVIEIEDDDPRLIAWLEAGTPSPLAVVTSIRDQLLTLAALRIAPLQDAVDLDDATKAEIALLKKWKQYRVAVNRLDLTVTPIVWPEQPS